MRGASARRQEPAPRRGGTGSGTGLVRRPVPCAGAAARGVQGMRMRMDAKKDQSSASSGRPVISGGCGRFRSFSTVGATSQSAPVPAGVP